MKNANTEPEIRMPQQHIRTFLVEAIVALSSSREETRFGVDYSEHVYFAELEIDGEQILMSVVLTVRRRMHGDRLYLSSVRPPSVDESTLLGIQMPNPWSQEFARLAFTTVRTILDKLTTTIGTSSKDMSFRRGILMYYGQGALAGEYWLGDWRIGPPPSDDTDHLFSEKVIFCDRLVPVDEPMKTFVNFRANLDRFSLLLSIFACRRFWMVRSEHVWVIQSENTETGPNFSNYLAPRGYIDLMGATEMPPVGTAAPLGPVSEIDRLNPDDWYGSGTAALPSDASTLFSLFNQADMATASKFLAAAKAYDTSEHLREVTPTGAMAYLVVAAESLLEGELPLCECCNQHRGVSAATKKLFFEELPGLKTDEEKVKRLLNQAYTIRSKHFHEAAFRAGEFEQGHRMDFLMPTRIEFGEQLSDLKALVNGLMVAWLIRRVTGDVWPRALQPLPARKPREYRSVSFHIGK